MVLYIPPCRSKFAPVVSSGTGHPQLIVVYFLHTVIWFLSVVISYFTIELVCTARARGYHKSGNEVGIDTMATEVAHKGRSIFSRGHSNRASKLKQRPGSCRDGAAPPFLRIQRPLWRLASCLFSGTEAGLRAVIDAESVTTSLPMPIQDCPLLQLQENIAPAVLGSSNSPILATRAGSAGRVRG